MLNKVMIIGNLGKDPELRFTGSDFAVASFSVATTERFKGKDGKTQDQTEWHRCTAWGRLAEICAEYLHKGSKVYLEGKLNTRKWTDKDGAEKQSTEIVVREMKMLDGKRDGGSDIPAPPMTDQDVPF